MLTQFLNNRNVPQIWESLKDSWTKRRTEILKILSEEEYGTLPKKPLSVSAEVMETDENFCAGKVRYQKVRLSVSMKNGVFSFPISVCIPKKGEKHPFFVFLNFRDNVPDKYYPTEEICDSGFAVLSFCYTDVTSDDADFTNGLAGVVYQGKARGESDGGKIALWSYAASRVMDYAETLPSLDLTRAAVIGHSRLGKTALLTGALDERFSCTVSNHSGCSGAALSRGKQGERIKDICGRFPYWFCEKYQTYIDNETNLPFDQHFLIAPIAPRKVYVASAEEDLWADPPSEFLSCAAASEAFEKCGIAGFISPDRLPIPGDVFHEGSIGYHLRVGTHYFNREDWNHVIAFLKK